MQTEYGYFMGETIEYWMQLKKTFERIEPVLNHPLVIQALQEQELKQLKKQRDDLDYRIKTMEAEISGINTGDA
jgi:uncharacterized coiled-coil DUF342 family protein